MTTYPSARARAHIFFNTHFFVWHNLPKHIIFSCAHGNVNCTENTNFETQKSAEIQDLMIAQFEMQKSGIHPTLSKTTTRAQIHRSTWVEVSCTYLTVTHKSKPGSIQTSVTRKQGEASFTSWVTPVWLQHLCSTEQVAIRWENYRRFFTKWC